MQMLSPEVATNSVFDGHIRAQTGSAIVDIAAYRSVGQADGFVSIKADILRELNEKLTEFVRLPKGWDGYVAKQIDVQTATYALTVLSDLVGAHSEAPSVVPVAGGGVQFEWSSGGAHLEILVNGPTEIHAWYSSAPMTDDGNVVSGREKLPEIRLMLREWESAQSATA